LPPRWTPRNFRIHDLNKDSLFKFLEIWGVSLVFHVAVPIVGRVRAGSPAPAIEDIEGYYNLDMSWANDKGCFFLRVEGDSMIEANILDGDLVLIPTRRTRSCPANASSYILI